MVGTLTADEARAVAWAGENLDSLTLSVRTKKQKASMTVYNMRSDIQAKLQNGEPHFIINLTGKAELNSVIPVLKAKDIVGTKDIEQAANDKVNAHLTHALQTAKHQGADILRLGYRLEWRHPQVWKKLRPTWVNYVKNDLQFTVKTNINIQFVGSESSF
ncbi:Ger(x)C family spore germination C-terminal domain-containing protein [Paenibacillus amylolyticus]|nr:Ger(x)C family spore germination C-terminal domain-containing protein [Paenibacillus amylolyticus]WFR61900.1 Ger(x)C family spore germination C-terminal domain-containing protein [Paenibacillus amylolyticus]